MSSPTNNTDLLTSLRVKLDTLALNYPTCPDLDNITYALSLDFDDDKEFQQALEKALLYILSYGITNTATPLSTPAPALEELAGQFKTAYDDNPDNFIQLEALADWILSFLNNEDVNINNQFDNALKQYFAGYAPTDESLKLSVERNYDLAATKSAIATSIVIYTLGAIVASALFACPAVFVFVMAIIFPLATIMAIYLAFSALDTFLLARKAHISLNGDIQSRANDRAELANNPLINTLTEDKIASPSAFFTAERKHRQEVKSVPKNYQPISNAEYPVNSVC